jgi:hypothetical protein
MKSLRSAGRSHAARAWPRYAAAPWKNDLVGQHAQAGRAMPGIAGGDLGGHEVLAQHTFARARLLDLRDHRGLALRHAAAQRLLEAPHVAPLARIGAHCRKVALCLGLGHLVALGRNDALQDVAHAREVRCAWLWPAGMARRPVWCRIGITQPASSAA